MAYTMVWCVCSSLEVCNGLYHGVVCVYVVCVYSTLEVCNGLCHGLV